MKQIGYVIGVLMLVMIAGTTSAADESGIAATLRQVVNNNLAAFNSESVPETLQSVHTKSPDYVSMQEALPGQFDTLDARTEVVSFHYIGHDDEFAVARVKLKTVDQSGQPFATNILDTITVFHQEDGDWKYWSNHVLGVELVE